MANGKSSFMFYCDWKETFDALPNEKAGELIKHILTYVNDENPETEDLLIKAVFANIKTTLKRDLKKWERKSEQNKINALKRWDANACERIKNDANHTDKDIDNDKVKDKVLPKGNDIPSLEEFLDYGKQLTKEAFIRLAPAMELKYESWKVNGWKTGGEKPREIKNWKNTLANTIPHLKPTEEKAPRTMEEAIMIKRYEQHKTI